MVCHICERLVAVHSRTKVEMCVDGNAAFVRSARVGNRGHVNVGCYTLISPGGKRENNIFFVCSTI